MLSGYYEDKLTIHLVMESPCGGGGGGGGYTTNIWLWVC